MQMDDGFYKVDGGLLYGPTCVLAPTFELLRELHDTYSYPVDGWHWFDSEAQARAFFDLPSEAT
jgi:hypothetical protein